MLKEFSLIEITLEKTVSTATPSSGTNFSKGLREYYLNPIQVRYLAALRPEVMAELCLFYLVSLFSWVAFLSNNLPML